jgi:hypothetical protein
VPDRVDQITLLEVLDPGTHGSDPARPVRTERDRKRRLLAGQLDEAAFPLQGVPLADPGVRDADQHLPRPDLGHLSTAELQHVQAAKAVDRHGIHLLW